MTPVGTLQMSDAETYRDRCCNLPSVFSVFTLAVRKQLTVIVLGFSLLWINYKLNYYCTSSDSPMDCRLPRGPFILQRPVRNPLTLTGR
jgi:hypothetical protein